MAMALEVAAGAFLGKFFEYLLRKMESPEVINFFRGSKDLDEGLLRKLKITMNTVSGLLDQAEEKQISVPSVKRWLDDLKDAAYQADDFLDQIAFRDHHRFISEPGSLIQNARKFIPSCHSFEKALNLNLKEILDLIEHLLKQMIALGLTLRDGIGEKLQSQPTTSLPDVNYDFHIRHTEKESIFKSLLSDDKGIGVICIVGQAGIGKTTVARQVYNDKRVEDVFDHKAWVYVSQEFNVSKITKDMVSQVCPASSSGSDQKLQEDLQKELNEKKFLLVLDDVWGAKDVGWENLFKPLMFGTKGMTKVIITSRVQSVVSGKQAIQNCVCLNKLEDEECWTLLQKYAFVDGNPSADPGFGILGRKIAKKCCGLPFAVKVIGSVLRSRSSVAEWESISESNLWGDLVGDHILPVLKLTYHYLPSHLKQCVAYCGIFPKGYVFRKEFLIHLWIGEGFLLQSESKKSVEDWGRQCFDSLVSISFFEQAKDNEAGFTMHDLVHDLSKSVLGDFGFRLGDHDGSREVPMKARHLFVKWGYGHDISKCMNEGQLLRSFLVADCGDPDPCVYDNKKMLDLLEKLKFLRVLHLEKQWAMSKMPSFIGKLNHLRYLSLHGGSMKKLPESLCCLYYLQIFILWDCKNLVELPEDMRRLINLFCLDVGRTGLRDMPPRMGELVELQTLTTFVLGKNGRSRIKELGKLLNLEGKLCIEIRHDFIAGGDATEDAIVYPELLNELEFKWDGVQSTQSRNLDQAQNLLEGLRPHSKVETLSIIDYEGTHFPDRLSRLSNLVTLNLSQCKNCSSLPSLGQLASLKYLSVIGFDGVESIGSEFYGTNQEEQPFRSLQTLRFQQMPNWQKWESTAGAFPKLETLCVDGCQKLSKDLPSELPCLSQLDIQQCEQLALTLPKVADSCNMKFSGGSRSMKLVKASARWQYLKVGNSDCAFLDDILKQMEGVSTASLEIEFGNCDSVYCFPLESFPKIKTLRIRGCPNLQSFSATSSSELIFPCQNLYIVNCANLSLSPLLSAQAVETIMLEDSSFILRFARLPSNSFCLQVIFLPNPAALKQNLMSEHVSTIQEIEIIKDVKYLNLLDGFPNLESLKIVDPCISPGDPLSLMEMANPGDSTYLISWIIYFSNDIVIFPRDRQPAEKLTSLTLRKCNKLKSLPEWMNQLFPCLENLEIVNCSELESFPGGSLPSRLKVLHVENCCMLPSLTISATVNNNNECEETLPNQSPLPSALVILKLRKLPKLNSLHYGVLEKLTDLEIWECPELQSVPQGTNDLLPSLRRMSISLCPKLKSFMKGDFSSTFKSLDIQHCDITDDAIMSWNLQKLPNFSELAIAGCQYVLSEEMLFPSTLSMLRLQDINKQRALKLNGLGQLTQLLIGNCPKLRHLPEYMQDVLPSLTDLTIHDCPVLESFLRGGLPSKLEGLYVWKCDKLVAGLLQYNLRRLSSLSILKIGGYEDAESLPEETLFPSTLTSLELSQLENLKCLKLQHLKSLQDLIIEECPKLEDLPDELLYRHSATFHGCPLLQMRM
ncbi:NB-ARC domain-containing disease resistance protein [Euphorbia peplus]|nr:NB-ARC domain-containing disease resistance protein [Euphorbia peplus]